MATNLADIFFGGVQSAAGMADRRRQTRNYNMLAEMEGVKFNQQQYDRNMVEYGRRTTRALTELQKDGTKKFAGTDKEGYFINKDQNDYDLQDFMDVYGEEEAVKIFNNIGFGAGALGINKFIGSVKRGKAEDGSDSYQVDVGVYDKDGEGNPFAYSERFTEGGKKRADGGEYKDIDVGAANEVFKRYTYGVRGAGGQLPQIGQLAGLQKGAFPYGDRGAVEEMGKQAKGGKGPTSTKTTPPKGEGFGVTYSDPNPSGQTDADPTAPPIKNVPMEDDIMEMLPQLKQNGMATSVGGYNDPMQGAPLFLDPDTLEGFEDYIETGSDIPFDMTQEQWDSLSNEQQAKAKFISSSLSAKNISAGVGEVLMPEGSRAITGGGVISRVRSDAMDYKDGKKLSTAGLTSEQRTARSNANKFYANNENEIYGYLQNNPEAYKDFKKDPIAFATNPKYSKNGKLITKASASDKINSLKIGKNITQNKDGTITGTASEADQDTAATIISNHTDPKTGSVNMRAYGRNARINMAKTVLASLPQNMHSLYAPMLAVFEETGMMTLDPAKLQTQQLNARTQAKFSDRMTPGTSEFVTDTLNLLTGFNPADNSYVDFDMDDLPVLTQQISTHISTAQSVGDIHGLSQITGLALQKYVENQSTSGFMNTIKSIFLGSPNDGGMRITPNIRLYTRDGQLTTDRAVLDDQGGYISVIGEDGTQVGGQIKIEDLIDDLDQQALNLLIGFAQKATELNSSTAD